MDLSFNKIECRIGLNETRLDYENKRLQLIQSRIAYLTIVYSILSIYVVQIFQFLFGGKAHPEWFFVMAACLYILAALTSIIYAIRLLMPKEVAYTHQPQYFFEDVRNAYIKAGMTDDNELDLYIKATYVSQLEEAVASNHKLGNRKSYLYNRAFRSGLVALVPYIVCVIGYFTGRETESPSVDLHNFREVLHYQDSLVRNPR